MKKKITVEIEVELNPKFYDQSDKKWLKETEEGVVSDIEEVIKAFLQSYDRDDYNDVKIIAGLGRLWEDDYKQEKTWELGQYLRAQVLSMESGNVAGMPVIEPETLDEAIDAVFSKFNIRVRANDRQET